ncbi:CDP-alcohol phosphatidyltransferase family protein [Derxia lacustris]|uniref:CDP-alcohol phosphatidyltransferase family protein n=1 Tax=Derxia lacustris TaxID=764842 RepID=UPI00111BDBBF|nr:CDP-alcohol phosphatidyltransferase family protein [Derxia lacustris]
MKRALGATAMAVALAAGALAAAGGSGWRGLAQALAVYAAGAALVWRGAAGLAGAGADAGLRGAGFGSANCVTLLRFGIASVLAAALGAPGADALAATLAALAALAAALDAIDGPLARRSGTASAFGARFDMEADAFFTLLLALLVVQLDKAGAWVLASGLMRYGFVAAAWVWPWLAAPLAPSWRRKAVCVVQITALVACLSPLLAPAGSAPLAAASLGLLAWSFAVDVRALWRSRPAASAVAPGWLRALRWLLAAAALDALLVFDNDWPGFGVMLPARLSAELGGGLLLLAGWIALRGRLSARAASALAAATVTLMALRYVDVTVPAQFGRPLNLYWDGRHAVEVVRLGLLSVPVWQAALALALAGVLALLGASWLLARLLRPLLLTLAQGPVGAGRLAALPAGLLGLALLAGHALADPEAELYAEPTLPGLARQLVLLHDALAPTRAAAVLPPSPSFAGNLDALAGADVLLVFAESYGSTSFDDPAQAAALAGSRQALERAIAASGRAVLSARLRSPTFGGGSWLAHAAVLTGIDTADPEHADRLLASGRPTLVRHFARHGYRTVGWMPGIQRPWPEGEFYGFERLAGADAIGYAGPQFGYWRIPDQAALALLRAQELGPAPAAASLPVAASANDRRPRFVVFPTVGTHAPFHPLPPYLADWSRAAAPDGYRADQLAAAMAAPMSWSAPLPAYLAGLRYQYDWLAGWMALPTARPQLLIVVGDHQPLAAVTGPRASWDVPVHVISGDAALLRRFAERGFAPGLVPRAPALGGMDDFTRLLLAVFDRPASALAQRH